MPGGGGVCPIDAATEAGKYKNFLPQSLGRSYVALSWKHGGIIA